MDTRDFSNVPSEQGSSSRQRGAIGARFNILHLQEIGMPEKYFRLNERGYLVTVGLKTTTSRMIGRFKAAATNYHEGGITHGDVQRYLKIDKVPSSILTLVDFDDEARDGAQSLSSLLLGDGVPESLVAKVTGVKKSALKKSTKKTASKVATAASPKTRSKRAARVKVKSGAKVKHAPASAVEIAAILDEDDDAHNGIADADTVEDFSGMSRADLIAILSQ